MVGIDIHPVAVQLAKASWVMAAAGTIRAARDEDANTGAVSAPVYLGDSMQLRYDTGTLTASQSIELKTGETLHDHQGEIIFSIPKELARQQAGIDRLISELATAIDEGRDTDHIADAYEMSNACRQSIQAVAATMQALHAADRNHVWAYYIRNMIRPAVIAEEKVDRIIGNPPWLTYNQSSDIIREELRSMSENRYQIWAGGQLAPHQDMATLFYTRCAELYARPDTKIGMVLPHSALRTGQHLKWRSGSYRQKGGRNAPIIGLDLRDQEPWDLDNVVPDFFPMPASVAFARYIGVGQGTSLAPATVQVWRGNWEDDYQSITKKSEALHHDDGKYKSPYAELSSNGATIQDRRLFFVETVPHTAMLPTANTTNVKPRLGNQDKVTYEGQMGQLDGIVHDNHLFDVYMGECIAPYVALDPLTAALPAHRTTMIMPLNHDDCSDEKHNACRLDVDSLHDSMRRRWEKAAELYRKTHEGQSIEDLYKRLNHQRVLTSQLEYLQEAIAEDKAFRIAYTSAGRPTATIIKDHHAVLENALFQTVCKSEAEAYYLIAIINSTELAKRAKPFCPTNWAKEIRHFHKHGWKLPIPRYADDDPLHVQLSELGTAAEQECRALIWQSDIMTKPAGDAQSRAARRLLRHEWQPTSETAQDIEDAVAQLLSDPAQAALAERQMTNQ